ncbi:hypothetical protein [Sporofaciens sp. SGI.106]|uniref:hypothetical protein n=1 Tax=Sporofaciens sp. SGI.106 TaxID=3420568 RepID=UPI003D017747
MKVRVTQQFNDKHSKILHRIGDELDLSVDRINEILRVGNFIEIVEEETEQTKPTEQNELVNSETNEESVEEEQPETVKTTGRRKRSK